jgi:riboflavin biosynthesis pyrimidine reductase
MLFVLKMTYLMLAPSCVARTRQTSRHSPSRVVRTRQTRRHFPSRVVRTRQTRRHSPSRVARTRQTCRHSPKAIFEKNVTRLDKFARVTRESCEFGVSGHSLI